MTLSTFYHKTYATPGQRSKVMQDLNLLCMVGVAISLMLPEI